MKHTLSCSIYIALFIFSSLVFGCKKDDPKNPSLITYVDNIARSSAKFGAIITYDGNSAITAKGFCYSTSPNPTISNTILTAVGIDTISVIATGLTPNKTYYVRAYATTNNGTGYGNEVIFTTLPPFSVGDNYAGGIICYIDATGEHGLIRTSSPFGPAAWGCTGTNITGTATGMGNGPANTIAVVNACSTTLAAAKICDALILNGYTDWFLPSKDELIAMCVVMDAGDRGDKFFWSSSQEDNNKAIMQGFEFCVTPAAENKDSLNWFWPVRSF